MKGFGTSFFILVISLVLAWFYSQVLFPNLPYGLDTTIEFQDSFMINLIIFYTVYLNSAYTKLDNVNTIVTELQESLGLIKQ